ncbi:MAG: FHA domain-containing protein [Lachnospiraceae bacterium]|nr:FHA domain-containing protein [Lachnospiraceae bacterium]
MLETEFIRSLQSNYERVHLSDRPDEQRYQYCILTRGGIRGLLPCSLRYINGEAYLYYDITSRQNVAQLYGKQLIDRAWFRDFLWSYEQVCQELGRFLLDEKNILVYPEQIFEDLSNHNFFFLYLPYNEEGNGFMRFLEFVLEHMDYDDLELVERVYFMYEQYEKYGDVYLQGQIFEDGRSLNEGGEQEKTLDSVMYFESDGNMESDLINGREEDTVISVTEDTSKEKKSFFGRFGLKKKKYAEQKQQYRETMLAAMEGRAVAEETDYLEEDYGRTIYIEQKEEETGIRKLYTPDGRVVAKLEKDVFVIGKQKDEVDLVLEDDTISRLHARICKEEDIIYLEDLNSTNGTFKNGLRLQPYEKRRLEEGDEVRFGKLLFVYR